MERSVTCRGITRLSKMKGPRILQRGLIPLGEGGQLSINQRDGKRY